MFSMIISFHYSHMSVVYRVSALMHEMIIENIQYRLCAGVILQQFDSCRKQIITSFHSRRPEALRQSRSRSRNICHRNF
jgi:hypothetical protein